MNSEHPQTPPIGAIESEDPLSLQDSLALLEAQSADATRKLQANPAPILGMWGLAWLAGFGAFYLASPKGPGPYLPAWVAGMVLGLAFAAAVAVSLVQGAWRGRGVEGPSRQVQAMYGWSWPVAFAGLWGINAGLMHRGLPSDLITLLWTGSALLVVGLLYLAGGIIWGDRVQYGVGVWILVTGAASVSIGVPGNFAVVSLAGGGGLLAAAALARARNRRSRPTLLPPTRRPTPDLQP
jgi:hypothetical protein